MTVQVSQKDKLVTWIERSLGGSVERCESQGRWRPAWYADLRLDGNLVPLYVRGDRNEAFPPWPIEYEAEILQILEREGIPVPQVYGVCDAPHAIVMSRAPGHNNFGSVQSDEERASILNHLAEVMAAMHSLEIEQFVDKGVRLPQTAEDAALNYYRECEKIYLQGKMTPDPRIEFVRRWIRRSVPRRVVEPRFTHQDSGQFVFESGRITAMLDFELACLGDPLIDLAALRTRALTECMGDIRPVFNKYRYLTHREIDRDLLAFHSIAWQVAVNFVVTPALASPNAGSDYVVYLGWYMGALLEMMRDMAEIADVVLEPVSPQTSRPSPWSPVLGLLATKLANASIVEDEYQRSLMNRCIGFAQRVDALGADHEMEYLIKSLLGRNVGDWRQADQLLEEFVLRAGPEYDKPLITLFYRWACRQAQLLDGLVYHPALTQSAQRLGELADS